MGRYTPEGKLNYYWLPAVSTPAAPTTAEFAAGKKLSCEMADFPDMALTGATADVPDLCSTFTKKIAGPTSVGDTTAEFWADDTPSSDSTVIKGILAQGASGFLIVIEPVSGAAVLPIATTKCEVWAATVISNSMVKPSIGEGRKYSVGFAFTAPPVVGTVT